MSPRDLSRALRVGAGGLLLGTGVYLGWRILRRSPRAPDADAAVPEAPPLDHRLLVAAEATVPPGAADLRPGDPKLDPAYGGRLADVEGAPAWGYYQERLVGGASGGTTCGVTLAYWMGRAGWPAAMVNRRPDDAAGAPGAGFVPGLHVSRIVAGARSRGWYLAPGRGARQAGPQLGDAYHVDHPPRPNSDHVGVVESVSAPRTDGTQIVITIDGGQGKNGADVGRRTRILSADGRTLTLDGAPARVLGWIRARPDAPGTAEGVA